MHIQPCSSSEAILQKGNQNFKEFRFVGGNVDPCLNIKKSTKGIVYIALYVDDNLMVGDIKAIDDAIAALKNNGLVLKIVEELQDYLSYKVKFLMDKKRGWLGQAHVIKNLEKKYGKCVHDVQSHITLGMPKFLIGRPMVESERNSTEDQWEYWLGVGMLLYLVKHLHPDLVNATRELSKANDGATLQLTKNFYMLF